MTQLHRWPVKSMGGEPVNALAADVNGAAGDRAHAVFDVHKGAPRRLTAREAPRLLAWKASYPGDPGRADPDRSRRPAVALVGPRAARRPVGRPGPTT